MLCLKPGRELPEIALLKVPSLANRAREEASAERTVGYSRNAEFAGSFEKADVRVLDVHGEGAVFDLDCLDRVYGVASTKSLGGRIR